MSDSPPQKVQATFSTLPETLAKLDKIRERERRSRSFLVALAVDEFIERDEAAHGNGAADVR